MSNQVDYIGKAIIIDDQDCVVSPLKRILEYKGFQEVLTANSGEDGFKLIENDPSQVRIVFLDMVMPGWSGVRTFNAIKQIVPSIPVVIMSGFLETQFEESFHLPPKPSAFLQKPFDLATFEHCLDKCMGLCIDDRLNQPIE